MTVLIAYATVEGQTGKIARFVDKQVRDAGQETALFDTSDLTGEASFDGIDRVILAAPVHERRHPQTFEVFVSGNRASLGSRRVLLLSISLSAAFEDYREEAQDYVDEMKLRTGLEPEAELLVAGAIRPESYDYYAAEVLRHVVLKGKPFDPTTKRHEFTDWDEIASCVASFLKDTASAK